MSDALQPNASNPFNTASQQEVTLLLQRLESGESAAADQLLPLVYNELRRLAASRLASEHGPNTLQPTALVHEAYVRLVGQNNPVWRDKRHFFGAAAQAMRNILVDQYRRKRAVKHGGGGSGGVRGNDKIPIDEVALPVEHSDMSDDLELLNQALKVLESQDARKGQIVNLRYFAGLTAEETAQALEISLGTVEREWRYIRSWLKREMQRLSGSQTSSDT